MRVGCDWLEAGGLVSTEEIEPSVISLFVFLEVILYNLASFDTFVRDWLESRLDKISSCTYRFPFKIYFFKRLQHKYRVSLCIEISTG